MAVILPAYNEEQTIGRTMREFHSVAPDAFFCVVDNNSTDRTADNARDMLRELQAEGVVLREERQGKGNAVRRALTDVDADVYVLADADCTYPAGQLPELLAPVMEGTADMVCGDRLSGGDYFKENRRLFHGFGNRLVQGLVNRVSGRRFKDIMTGYRVMSRDFVRIYPIITEGFQLETDMTLFAAQARMRVLEIPIRYRDRPVGSVSKLHTFRDGVRILWSIFTLFRYCSPLTFFSLVAALFALCSLLSGGVVIGEWLQTRYITHVPLAILAVSLGILAAISLGTGFVLDAFTHQRRLDLEIRIQSNATRRFTATRNKGGNGRNTTE
ncbi:MAG: glycosyltransferase family 2 protein [Desulfovibrio sp.]|jgi:glycosyltransferase involved in cell wall biosynthesis|nr:glycosyltransferase family 2 protein [Desulfovibrio sp.]